MFIDVNVLMRGLPVSEIYRGIKCDGIHVLYTVGLFSIAVYRPAILTISLLSTKHKFTG